MNQTPKTIIDVDGDPFTIPQDYMVTNNGGGVLFVNDGELAAAPMGIDGSPAWADWVFVDGYGLEEDDKELCRRAAIFYGVSSRMY